MPVCNGWPDSGLVLIGGLNRLSDDVFADVWSVVESLTDPISEQFVPEFQSSTLADPVPARFFDQLVAESLKAPARVSRAAFAGIRTMPPAHDARITAPTLLFWGDQDALVPCTEQENLLSAIPDARLVVYSGAGHSPNWEQPTRVGRDIESFLYAEVDTGVPSSAGSRATSSKTSRFAEVDVSPRHAGVSPGERAPARR